nr:hypothetical protein [Tanacetum cinerariifolium]
YEEIAKIHAEEELEQMIEGLDMSNETIAKHLEEYEQAAAELTIGERIKLISELVKYQDHHSKILQSNETIAKHLEEYEQAAAELTIRERIELIFKLVKYQDHHSKILQYRAQQRKTRTKKQKRDFYMAVIRNNLGWKVKDFKGMSFEEVEAKFKTVWEQIEGKCKETEDIKEVPEEKIKELIRLVPIKEVYVEALQVKHPIIDWKVHTEGQRSYWKITRLGGSSASYQFFVDMLKQIDREDLNQLWAFVKETLSVKLATDEKEMELWVELKRLYEPDVEDHLWTHTQHIMHAPVEWRLYDTCGIHHASSLEKGFYSGNLITDGASSLGEDCWE